MAIRLITILFRRAPWKVVLSAIAGIFSGLASTGLLALLNEAMYDKEMGERFILSFLALCLLVPVTNLLSRYLVQKLGQGETSRLRFELARQILETPLRKLEKLGTPRLMSVLTTDVNTVSATSILIPNLVVNVSVVAGCLAYLGWLSMTLFWILMGLIVVGSLSYQLPTFVGRKLFLQSRRIEDRLFKHFRGVTEGTKELMINSRRRSSFLDSLKVTTNRQRDLRVKASMVLGGAAAWGQLLVFIVVGGILILGSRFEGVTHEDLVRYVLVLIYMMAPLQICLDAFPHLARADVAVGRIEELGFSLGGTAGGQAMEPRSGTGAPWQELWFENVTYSYSDEAGEGKYDFHLGPIDLRFRQGELVFLVGGNGSGKTSLAKLVLGLYVPTGGRIVVDGEAVTLEGLNAYRDHFSTVFADFFLFEELLGLEEEGLDERAGVYLEKLDLHGKVEVEDGVLSTSALSQGQRKRLALLVAYLEDRQVYLFDEWAADQDPVFKRFFYEALLPEIRDRGKTVFVISHDDHYYHVADRVIKMDAGLVEFDGRAEDMAPHVA